MTRACIGLWEYEECNGQKKLTWGLTCTARFAEITANDMQLRTVASLKFSCQYTIIRLRENALHGMR